MIIRNAPITDGLLADIACGMARLGPELEARGWTGRYFGVDLSPRLVYEAANVFRDGALRVRMPLRVGDVPRSELVEIKAPTLAADRSLLAVGNADRLPLKPESCDVVVALNLVDRVPDPVVTVTALWGHVKRGGILVLADPFHWEGQSANKRIYSFGPVEAWLPDAEVVDQEEIIFAVRRRESRRIAIYEDLVMVFRRNAGQRMPEPPSSRKPSGAG